MAKQTTHLLVHNGDVEFGMTWQQRHWRPHADVYRTDLSVTIVVEISGVNESDVHLHFEPGLLSVEGQRGILRLPRDAKCLQVEINHGHFRREFKLPREVDGNGITAAMKDGLLLITIPFKAREEAETVKVQIN